MVLLQPTEEEAEATVGPTSDSLLGELNTISTPQCNRRGAGLDCEAILWKS